MISADGNRFSFTKGDLIQFMDNTNINESNDAENNGMYV